MKAGVAAIKYVDAAANFWKHRDEWKDDAWDWVERDLEDVRRAFNVSPPGHILEPLR